MSNFFNIPLKLYFGLFLNWLKSMVLNDHSNNPMHVAKVGPSAISFAASIFVDRPIRALSTYRVFLNIGTIFLNKAPPPVKTMP